MGIVRPDGPRHVVRAREVVNGTATEQWWNEQTRCRPGPVRRRRWSCGLRPPARRRERRCQRADACARPRHRDDHGESTHRHRVWVLAPVRELPALYALRGVDRVFGLEVALARKRTGWRA